MTREEVAAELARDGAWTAAQLDHRTHVWDAPAITQYVTTTTALVRPTGWSRRRRAIDVVHLNARGETAAATLGVSTQQIRTGELEHALGLAELRWRLAVPYTAYTAQDGLGRLHRRGRAAGGSGLGRHVADGVAETARGAVLLEYDHGRYTARQVREKLAAFHATAAGAPPPAARAVWGVPTQRRNAWLRSLGVDDVIVLETDTWLR